MTVKNDIKIERCTVMKQTAAKQCAKIHPFLPIQRGNVRISNIDFINAVLQVLENGCKRRALPERFGNWFTVHTRFRRWSKAGANALLAVRCCVENIRWPDFLGWKADRVAAA